MWSLDKPLDRLALTLLDRLEEREYELLTWGFIDSGFTRDEIEELANEICDQQAEYVRPQDTIQLLRDRRLLFDFPIDGQRLYRSRFAETVRLFAQLRQMFRIQDWAVAPRLVADYRLAIKPRRYPLRHITIDQLVDMIQGQHKLSATDKALIGCILDPPNSKKRLLADFQARSATHLLTNLGHSKSGGTIICAGTGTGKTLAFYLPSFIKIVGHMKKEQYWTQVIAIYPRTELLKDQYSEVYSLARLTDAVAQKYSGRKIRIGTFFTSTPTKASVDEIQKFWDKGAGGFICPFLRCPECGGDLVWQRGDIEAGREQMLCINGQCRRKVHSDEVLLTRDSMQKTPPDILFTTTEMLNRQISSSWNRHIFGIGVHREHAPYAMLLDEAHTYSGTHGAQVALLIRRWRSLVKYPVHFVGLSATLTDPQGVFAQLVGLPGVAVTPIEPEKELQEEGKEYQLVLRGDPVSAVSLLSTTIQAAMLLCRVLDPLENGPSDKVFCPKLFAFTDDLDVTNRLFHNLQDAEGLDSYGRKRKTNDKGHSGPLASLRSQVHSGLPQRFREGQAWRLCEMIGYDLDTPLSIGRTSSQDRGVDSTCQAIVATAALEVGYDDPLVGAVLQHKAPRDAAQFLQRKGRAGRLQITRPWTVVVLSDYGRDRLAYQAYEQLFDPILDRATLPTSNRYVLRIQMVFALMDWIAMQIPGNIRGSVWSDFAGPGKDNYQQQRQKLEAKLILELLTNKEKRDELAVYLERALGVPKNEVQALFWEPPRSLMTAVLPTILRRINTSWSRVRITPSEPSADYQLSAGPLPDFVPENLFSDLNIPEVQIRTPNSRSNEMELWPVPLTQALKWTAPGRVTRRFAVRNIYDSHWVEPPNLEVPKQDMPIQKLCTQYEDIGTFQALIESPEKLDAGVNIHCIRPWEISMTQIPPTVSNSSNAFLDWRSQLYSEHTGITQQVPPNLPLVDLIKSVTFFTHNMKCPMHVRRFTLGSNASIRLKNGKEHISYIRFTDGDTGKQAAVGFEHEVDGIVFRCNISDEFRHRILQGDSLKACRSAYFLQSVVNDDVLMSHGRNKFRLGWLGQVYLSMILEKAMRHNITVPEAARLCKSSKDMEQIDQVLNAIFQVVDIEQQEADEISFGDLNARARVHDAIRQLFQINEVCDRLADLAKCLWEEPGKSFDKWLQYRLKVTLGGALLEACRQITPQYQIEDLLLDIVSGPLPTTAATNSPEENAIWITESTIGGGGMVEEIVRQYTEDPRRFFLLAERSLGMSDFELVDEEMTRILELTGSSAELAEAFTATRAANSNSALNEARKTLVKLLSKYNILVTHSVMTTLNTRVLRVGSSPKTDGLIRDLLHYWKLEEDRLGVEIDARVFAYLASSREEFRSQIQQVLSDIGVVDKGYHLTPYAVLYGLLWPRGSIIRERALEAYNPYSDLPPGDPKLLRDELRHCQVYVSVDDQFWRDQVDDALIRQGVVHLEGRPDQRQLLTNAIIETTARPIETDFLRLYPYVVSTQRTTKGIAITFHLREATQ